jgi:uncharacterized YceG family protein
VGEPGDGVTDTELGTRRRHSASGRGLAVASVAVLVGVAAVVAVSLRHSSHNAAPGTTAPVAPPKPFRVVFPEGFTRAEMAHRVQVVAGIAHRERGVHPKLSATTYLAAAGPRRIPGFGPQKRPLEGFLFPATYDFLTQTTSRQLVQAQLTAFLQNWSRLSLSYARAHGLTPYDVLIIASMVEGEAQVPGERAKIAAVIYNRLRDHMPLQIDATTRYGLHIPPTQSLTQSELHSNNPYNTRDRPGLPPTPIGNPGLASLRAAAHPADVDYLYYVRLPDHRHHYFTDNYQDFLAHGG